MCRITLTSLPPPLRPHLTVSVPGSYRPPAGELLWADVAFANVDEPVQPSVADDFLALERAEAAMETFLEV